VVLLGECRVARMGADAVGISHNRRRLGEHRNVRLAAAAAAASQAWPVTVAWSRHGACAMIEREEVTDDRACGSCGVAGNYREGSKGCDDAVTLGTD
jgi:hypothetical protein